MSAIAPRTTRVSRIMAAVMVAGGLLSLTANAAPMIRLSDGTNTVTVADNDGTDANTMAGAVTFIGSVGAFNINVSTGLSKPASGTALIPDIDLNSVNSSTGAGTLTIEFTDTDFQASGARQFVSQIGGTTDGTNLSAQLYLDAANNAFAQSTLLTNMAFTGSPFAGTDTGAFDFGAGPVSYSLTKVVSFTHTRAGDDTSFDFETEIPVPATLAFLGMGLAGLGVAARRRRQA